MSKTVSELNALCDALSRMRKSTAPNTMYRRFCNPGAGTIHVRYIKASGKVFLVQFEFITWLGAVSGLLIDTSKYY